MVEVKNLFSLTDSAVSSVLFELERSETVEVTRDPTLVRVMLKAIVKIHKPLLLTRMVSETLKIMKYSKEKNLQLDAIKIKEIVTHLVEMHQLIDIKYLKFIER